MAHLSKADYFVADCGLDEGRELVAKLHYSGGAGKVAVYRHGLYRYDEPERLLGVALWLPPIRGAAKAAFDGDPRRVISLTRLAIEPEVPTNGATFLLARSIKTIKTDGRFDCLLTYADSWRGHSGSIYKAGNWEYIGETPKYPVWVNAEGRMGAPKSGAKNFSRKEMEERGFNMIGRFSKHKYRMVLR
jgi:hypothetical protein